MSVHLVKMNPITVTSCFAWIFGTVDVKGKFHDSTVRQILRYSIMIIYANAFCFQTFVFLFGYETCSFRTVSFAKAFGFASIIWMYHHGSKTLRHLTGELFCLYKTLPVKYIHEVKRRDLIHTIMSFVFIIVSTTCFAIVYREIIYSDEGKERRSRLVSKFGIMWFTFDVATTQFAHVTMTFMVQFYTVIIFSVYEFARHCNHTIGQIEKNYFLNEDYWKLFDLDVRRTRIQSLIEIRKCLSLYNSIVNTINDDLSFIAIFIFAFEFHFCTSGLAFYFIHLYGLSNFYGFIILGYVMVTLTIVIVHILCISDCSIRKMTHARLIASRIVSSMSASSSDIDLIDAKNTLSTFLSTNPLNILTAWNLFEIRARTGLHFINAVVPFTVMTINTWRELRIIWGDEPVQRNSTGKF